MRSTWFALFLLGVSCASQREAQRASTPAAGISPAPRASPDRGDEPSGGDARSASSRALLAFQQGRFEEALSLARASLGAGETCDARFVEGRVLTIRRDFAGAIQSYQRCTALDPARADAWSALTAVRLAVGDQLGAELSYAELQKRIPPRQAEDRVWSDVLRAPPDPAQVQEALDRCGRGTAAYLAHNDAEARHEMRAVLGTVPGHAHCWSELGKTEWRLGRPAAAEAAFRRALGAYRADQAGLRADTQGLLAALLVSERREVQEALALARAAIAVRGERPTLLDALGAACELAGDSACARESYAKLSRAEGATEALRHRGHEKLEELADAPSR